MRYNESPLKKKQYIHTMPREKIRTWQDSCSLSPTTIVSVRLWRVNTADDSLWMWRGGTASECLNRSHQVHRQAAGELLWPLTAEPNCFPVGCSAKEQQQQQSIRRAERTHRFALSESVSCCPTHSSSSYFTLSGKRCRKSVWKMDLKIPCFQGVFRLLSALVRLGL